MMSLKIIIILNTNYVLEIILVLTLSYARSRACLRSATQVRYGTEKTAFTSCEKKVNSILKSERYLKICLCIKSLKTLRIL